MSNSLWPHGLQHARLPCPSLSPRACSNSCPWSWWCHPTISFSVAGFSSCPQPFPTSRYFPGSWLFTLGGQSVGASASASVLPMNIYDFLYDWLVDFPSVQGTLKNLLQHHFESINSSLLSLLYGPALISVHDYWKNHSFVYTDLCHALTFLLI